MEEQLNKNENVSKSENSVEKKLSYEQLNDACNQLWQQNKQFAKRNRELEEFCMYKKLDYLFKVLEYGSQFPSDFVISCADEIKNALTVTQEESNSKGE